MMVAVAALALPRGPERRRLRDVRRSLLGLPGVLLVLGAVGLLGSGALLHRHLVEQGDYRSVAEERAEHAEWEQRWLAGAGAWQVADGRLHLRIDSVARRVDGEWTLGTVIAAKEHLDAELPPGLHVTAVSVMGRPVLSNRLPGICVCLWRSARRAAAACN